MTPKEVSDLVDRGISLSTIKDGKRKAVKSVWIIWNDGDYYGPHLSAIYETEELGNKILAELKAMGGYNYYLEEWKLDTKAP